MTANGDPVDLRSARLASAPGNERLQIRYTGIHLSAPERVQYFYKLDGLDPRLGDAPAAARVINYNSLRHGHYRFTVRAELPGGPAAEQSYEFEVLPQFYDTSWFRVLCLAALLAAGVGRLPIAAAADPLAVSRWCWRSARGWPARSTTRWRRDSSGSLRSSTPWPCACRRMPRRRGHYLDLARRMARHSLTEARRSVMDLRASALEGQDLAAALESGTRMWTAGSGIEVDVDVIGPRTNCRRIWSSTCCASRRRP